jgi:hypothetical protein
VGQVFVFSLTAALNPTLLTATTVMLLLPAPARLMLGYWLGAMMTSITLGLVIVFALEGSTAVNTTQHTLSPAADLALGALALVVAAVIGTGRHARRAKHKQRTEPPRWQRTLSRGTARTTFVVGALLTLPGASYLAGLRSLSKLGYPTATTVLAVIGFNLVMLILLEAPLLGYAIAPSATPRVVDRAKAWVARRGRSVIAWALAAVGAALIVKGLIGLL